MKTDLFICQCFNCEHQMIFNYEDGELFVNIHLIPEFNIFKRIWCAIKYIFGHRSKYGHFDEFIFNYEDIKRLKSIVDLAYDQSKCG